MRILLSVFAICCFAQVSFGQIIDFPDANFKKALLEYDPVIDTNGDGEIDVSEAEVVEELIIGWSNIFSLEGIMNFSELLTLDCSFNSLDKLDISNNLNLEILLCYRNAISNLDVSQNLKLKELNCSSNQLMNIDVTQNLDLNSLGCGANLISNIDISNNPKLEEFACNFNNGLLKSLDVTNNPEITFLQFEDNSITNIDLSQNRKLRVLYCGENLLTDLNFENNPDLTNLACSDNLLFRLDLSPISRLNVLWCSNNNIRTMFFKDTEMYLFSSSTTFEFDRNPLEYICADLEDFELIYSKLAQFDMHGVQLNSYCPNTYNPKPFSTVGEMVFDFDQNGCDQNDSILIQRRLNISDGENNGFFITDTSGEYLIQLDSGSYTITPDITSTGLFSSDPESITIDLPAEENPVIQDFCITPIGEQDDLEITIVPIDRARPGFSADYKIIYENKGNTVLAGDISFLFDGEVTNVESVSIEPKSQTENSLGWSFEDLLPFQKGEIYVTMRLNTPTDNPALNDGDILIFLAKANLDDEHDESFPDDPKFQLKQTVVNSYDPNDKTCLEGERLTPEMIGEYVHYLIRFENLGTAEAVNIRVADEIDPTRYDISTVEVTDASHNFDARIEGDMLEFFFRDINLPFDDENNDGYVAFKIKTLSTLKLGDSFANDAEIYFDYNAPIITNEYETVVAVATSTVNIADQDVKLTIAPNPAKGFVKIASEGQILLLDILSIDGEMQESHTINSSDFDVDLSTLASGVYIFKLTTGDGFITKKVFIE